MENNNYYFTMQQIPTIASCNPLLSPSDKLVFSSIYFLKESKHGSCFASNKYLAEYHGLSEIAIKKSVQKLEHLGYIKRKTEKKLVRTIPGNYPNEYRSYRIINILKQNLWLLLSDVWNMAYPQKDEEARHFWYIITNIIKDYEKTIKKDKKVFKIVEAVSLSIGGIKIYLQEDKNLSSRGYKIIPLLKEYIKSSEDLTKVRSHNLSVVDKKDGYLIQEDNSCNINDFGETNKKINNSCNKENFSPANKKINKSSLNSCDRKINKKIKTKRPKYKITTSTYSCYTQFINAGATKHKEDSKAFIITMENIHSLFDNKCLPPYRDAFVPEKFIDYKWSKDEVIDTFVYQLKNAKSEGFALIKSAGAFIFQKGFNGKKAWSPLLFWNQKMNKTEKDVLTPESVVFRDLLNKNNINHTELLPSDLNRLSGSLEKAKKYYTFFSASMKIQHKTFAHHFVNVYLPKQFNNKQFRLVYIRKKGFIQQYMKECAYAKVYTKIKINYETFKGKKITRKEYLQIPVEERRKEIDKELEGKTEYYQGKYIPAIEYHKIPFDDRLHDIELTKMRRRNR